MQIQLSANSRLKLSWDDTQTLMIDNYNRKNFSNDKKGLIGGVKKLVCANIFCKASCCPPSPVQWCAGWPDCESRRNGSPVGRPASKNCNPRDKGYFVSSVDSSVRPGPERHNGWLVVYVSIFNNVMGSAGFCRTSTK